MRGYRNFAEPEERDHRAQVIKQFPGPSENISPLAVPKGASAEHELRDCFACVWMPDCHASVVALGPFSLDVCEMQTSKRPYARAGEYTRRAIYNRTSRDAIMKSIQQRITFTMHDISNDTELPLSTIRGHMSHLIQEGIIRHAGRDGKNIIYELVE